MRRASRFRPLLVLLGLALVAVLVPALTACRDDGGDTAEQADTPEGTDESGSDDAVDADGQENGSDEDHPETLTIQLYFSYGGDRALAISREIPYTEAVATAAMEELIAGPTAAELGTWPVLSTNIPEGTELLGLQIDGGVATVDLSDEFESGGGTFSVTARLAEVVYTLCQFPTVDAVEFWIDGEPVEMFSTEGLMLDGPQEPDDYYELIPVDA